MSTATVFTTSEDGQIDQSLTMDKTGAAIEASVSSSTVTFQKQGFLFFDTADGSTGIPAGASIDSVVLNVYCGSHAEDAFGIYVFEAGASLGSTLEASEFDVGLWNILLTGGVIVGWNQITFPSPGTMNRAGYTNVRLRAETGGGPASAIYHSFENGSGNKAFLTITYTLPGGVFLVRELVHPMLRAQLRSRVHQRGVRAMARAVGGATQPPGYDTFERSDFLGDPVECYRFTQAASEWRFTSADEIITLLTGAYVPEPIVRDGADFSQEDTAGNITVRVSRLNPVAVLFVTYVPTSPVFLTLYRKHRSDPETIVAWQGRIVSCVFDGPEASFVCAPISQVFRRKVPAIVFESQCNWTLYGVGCGVLKAAFKDSGTVIEAVGVTVRASIFATRPDGWYRNGWAELPTGERQFVVDHVGDALTLMNSFPSLAAGASIDAFAGCDRTEAVCAAKFNNLVNHLGFPRVPTRNPYGGAIA